MSVLRLEMNESVISLDHLPLRLHALQLTNRTIHGTLDRAGNANQAVQRALRPSKRIPKNRELSNG
jgi:hypothetical protein